MAYDWKGLEERETRRSEKALLPLALGFLLAGVAGVATFFAFGRPSTPAGSVVFIVFGVLMLVQHARRRRRDSAQEASSQAGVAHSLTASPTAHPRVPLKGQLPDEHPVDVTPTCVRWVRMVR